jgi:hypothetical protein
MLAFKHSIQSHLGQKLMQNISWEVRARTIVEKRFKKSTAENLISYVLPLGITGLNTL